ncbi:hypothetical protein DSM03_11511 [Leeuwenhoekiella aestuarii]|uniref:DUF3299 domain-containing protein n=1 Tax=Leeuwenhoekiella aestuarii TaxID=2249426 RepID=A0A4Q0NP85_9FLAO|nr:hypothetical protein [Leeuwenhoekiella aestuarii]RXG11217.1 hypothetical protein DSM04_11311 [Leeuwenhoekiella aestuarii]RXG11583.1 hypothetical protein DSM03_11511 [Leeuwenhoekiella aestuarii]
MQNKCCLFILLLVSFFGFSQKNIIWEDLAQINFEEKYFATYGAYFLYPHFGSVLKALEGKEVSITGFFLNIDPENDIYILSKSPMSSCFFCGAAGPETAIELQFDNPSGFKTDDVVTVTGVLNLNADDINHFNYILTNCKAKRP